MRSWTRSRFEQARAEQPGSDVVWLRPRSPSEPRAAGPLARTAGASGQMVAYVATGLVIGAALPGTALAPVSEARAAFDPLKLPPPPPVAVAVEVVPTVFAPSLEERREVRRMSSVRQEMEQFLRFGSREVSRTIVDAIIRAAAATKVDPIYLMALADKESSFRADVKAPTSSAQGLFQFIDRTWLDVVRRFGPDHGLSTEAAAITTSDDRPLVADPALRTRILSLRSDPYLAAVMAAEMLKRDADAIGFRIGRELNATERYLAHFLGLEDAVRFLTLREKKKAPSAVQAFPAAARANTAIFYGPPRRGRKGRITRPSLSVPEVYVRIQGMIDPRVERFGDVTRYASATNPDS